MKICTITCHDVYNYGASLQAFALQHYLEMQGHNVSIIDYKPEYQPRYGFSTKISRDSVYYIKYQKYPILRVIKGIKEFLLAMPTRGRINAFNEFNKKYFHLTKRYSSFKELAEFPPQADVYIAGSDQIWNTKLSNGSDPAFYMKFGASHIRRISYAASFAYSEIFYGNDELVKSLLTNIDAISVRELTGVSLLGKLGYEGTHVFDPVFLLDIDQWKKTLNLESCFKRINGDYILVYDLRATYEIKKKAIELKSKYGHKIVAVTNKKKVSYADINVCDAGPVDFVKLIYNAQYILADSFHATAFSVIFHKQFWSYFHGGNDARIADMLGLIGLPERLNAMCDIPVPNWNIIQTKLDYYINESKKYLINKIKT
ncbi:MAG: polysaccharide pyruvyl transferase family protein [Muribaculaceae bacterium]|nr:polysaccharide pyruvyl transferase family protein [Muribaculaceae bacterium]